MATGPATARSPTTAPDNVVLDAADPTRVLAILDWEMATLGDPLMDLGNSLAYWVPADDDPIARATRRQPTHLPGMWSRRQVVDHYCARMGLTPANWTFYEVYGVFRLAAIAQQIYYRYHWRETRNPAFRWFLGGGGEPRRLLPDRVADGLTVGVSRWVGSRRHLVRAGARPRERGVARIRLDLVAGP